MKYLIPLFCLLAVSAHAADKNPPVRLIDFTQPMRTIDGKFDLHSQSQDAEGHIVDGPVLTLGMAVASACLSPRQAQNDDGQVKARKYHLAATVIADDARAVALSVDDTKLALDCIAKESPPLVYGPASAILDPTLKVK